MPDEGDPCEDEILQFLHMYLGYTLPNPIPSSVPQIEPIHRKTVLKMIGMSCSTATDIYHRPRTLMALDFVRRLFSKERVSSEEWDLSRSNRAFICFSGRFSTIRRLSSNIGAVFMFDLAAGSSQKWKLATTTARHALMICRLDPQMREDEIARFLVTRGVPFRTLQSSTTLPRTPFIPQMTIKTPYRPSGYQFNLQDYTAYTIQYRYFLLNPRSRAALMKGGYVWRVAIPAVSIATVISGPRDGQLIPKKCS